MTLQEVFDKVASHLLQQNARSRDLIPGTTTFRCLYKCPDGRRCAVGVLLDDSHYRASLEGQAVFDPPVWDALVASGVPDTDEAAALLTDLQAMHDGLPPEHWNAMLRTIAERLALVWQ